MNHREARNREFCFIDQASSFVLNYAGMKVEKSDFEAMADKFRAATSEMQKLEAGAIKNPDENRKVSHFTDRIIYPTSALFAQVEEFARQIHSGLITGSTGQKFDSLVVNGIGGSALGPQLLQFAANGPYWNELASTRRNGWLKLYFLDNTDPAGLNDLIGVMNPETTLHLVISKSGFTRETQNNMIALENFYRAKGLDFGLHSIAVTMRASKLDEFAAERHFLAKFEMADSIGGRTSETNIVGHLPAVLAGLNFKSFLAGACHMDELTRHDDYRQNPAMILAALWYIAGNGRGDRNMVIVPYSDRLILFSRYLQQLVMESLGKEYDLDGNKVEQGLSVFGNKGGTDAHAFIQQLNDGRDDFFITFIEILTDAAKFPIDADFTMGDFLHGFEAGLANALVNKGRQVICIELEQLTVYELGMLIALYERAVAIYAEFIHINAFHQPGVQAYKLAADAVLELQKKLLKQLAQLKGFSGTAEEIAEKIASPSQAPEIGGILNKLAANGEGVSRSYDRAIATWVYCIK